jgi:hypothetical protein
VSNDTRVFPVPIYVFPVLTYVFPGCSLLTYVFLEVTKLRLHELNQKKTELSKSIVQMKKYL